MCHQSHFLRYVVFTISSTLDMYNLFKLCNRQHNKHKQAWYQSRLLSIIHCTGATMGIPEKNAAVDAQCALGTHRWACFGEGSEATEGQSLLSNWPSPRLALLGGSEKWELHTPNSSLSFHIVLSGPGPSRTQGS